MLSEAHAKWFAQRLAQESRVPCHGTEALGPPCWLFLLLRSVLHVHLPGAMATMLPLLWWPPSAS